MRSPTPDLPADLIDRAVERVGASKAGIGSSRIVRAIVEQVAPLLVEHGRRQEAARWEARIEKQAGWEDRAKAERAKVARWHEESGTKIARDIRADEYRHHYAGRVLRSLLTGEGENGE